MLNNQAQPPRFLSWVHPSFLYFNIHKLTGKAAGIKQLLRESKGNLRLPKATVTAMETLLGHVPM